MYLLHGLYLPTDFLSIDCFVLLHRLIVEVRLSKTRVAKIKIRDGGKLTQLLAIHFD